MLIAGSKLFGTKDQATVDGITVTADRQAAAVLTWASGQSEFDSQGRHLGALSSSSDHSAVIRTVAHASNDPQTDWEVGSNAADTPAPGKSMIWHDIAAYGERVRITRCRANDSEQHKICARIDIFPWGNNESGDTALTYRFIDCAPASGAECRSSGKAAFWTKEQCQKWPSGGTVIKNPGGQGDACPSFAASDSCQAQLSNEPCVVDDNPAYQTPTTTASGYYPLLVSVNEGGYVTSDESTPAIDCPRDITKCIAYYPAASIKTVVLHAEPLSGYTFIGWSGDANCGVSHDCAVTMSKASSVTANFADNSLLSGTTTTPVVLSGGESHTCAVNTRNAAYCWGDNSSGQLGDGTKASRNTPTAVYALDNGVKSIAAGGNHSCSVQVSGSVRCWGSDAYGQLGSAGDSSTPKLVDLGNGVLAQSIATGAYHSCALTTTGTVECWGRNNYGQLGNGTNSNSESPVLVSGLNDATAIWSGQYHTCVQTSTAVKCWGIGTSGQLGNNSSSSSSTPVMVSLLPGGSVGGYYGSHSCAVNSSGAALCWGYNSNGQIGDGSTTTRLSPASVVGIYSGTQQVVGGAAHSCALTGGAVKCWGLSNDGQLGNGLSGASSSAPWSYSPVGVSGGLSSGIASITAGAYHNCSASTANQVKCWGRNNSGQLGDGTNSSASTPVLVTLP